MIESVNGVLESVVHSVHNNTNISFQMKVKYMELTIPVISICDIVVVIFSINYIDGKVLLAYEFAYVMLI